MVLLDMAVPVVLVNELRRIHNWMRRNGYGQAMLTGGCLRDAYYLPGIHPKDVDIAVWGLDKQTIVCLYKDLMELGYEPGQVLDNTTQHIEPSDADTERLDRVWQFTSPEGHLVDFLFYTEKYTSAEQIVLSHDHSVNMFGAMISDDQLGSIQVFYPWHNMGTCCQMRDHVSAQRIEHIQGVCKRLGVTYRHDHQADVVREFSLIHHQRRA